MAGIPTAREARQCAIKNLTVLAEIHAIETAILTAVEAGELTATVNDNTTMTSTTNYADSTDTDAEVYYDVWQGLVTDAARSEEMDMVIDHFQNLGYNIVRRQNSTTLSTFRWVVSW